MNTDERGDAGRLSNGWWRVRLSVASLKMSLPTLLTEVVCFLLEPLWQARCRRIAWCARSMCTLRTTPVRTTRCVASSPPECRPVARTAANESAGEPLSDVCCEYGARFQGAVASSPSSTATLRRRLSITVRLQRLGGMQRDACYRHACTCTDGPWTTHAHSCLPAERSIPAGRVAHM
jgi:hypothetical protein